MASTRDAGRATGREDARCPPPTPRVLPAGSRLPSRALQAETLQLMLAAQLRSSSPFQPLSQGRTGIKRKQIKPNGLIAIIFPCLFAVPCGSLKKGKGMLFMRVQSWSSLCFLLESDPGQPKIKPATFEHPISSSYKLRCANTSVCKPTRDPVRSNSNTSPARSQLPSPTCPTFTGDTHPPRSPRKLFGARANLLFGGSFTCHHAWGFFPEFGCPRAVGVFSIRNAPCIPLPTRS